MSPVLIFPKGQEGGKRQIQRMSNGRGKKSTHRISLYKQEISVYVCVCMCLCVCVGTCFHFVLSFTASSLPLIFFLFVLLSLAQFYIYASCALYHAILHYMHVKEYEKNLYPSVDYKLSNTYHLNHNKI